MQEISEFKGKYFFLSNFYKKPFIYNGLLWPSAEHAFQAAKSINSKEIELIRTAENPSLAKRLGRRTRLRQDWEQVKDGLMEEILQAKFTDAHLSNLLLSTSPCTLIEGNNWGDTYWGVDGTGLNKLGILLMKIRDKAK